MDMYVGVEFKVKVPQAVIAADQAETSNEVHPINDWIESNFITKLKAAGFEVEDFIWDEKTGVMHCNCAPC